MDEFPDLLQPMMSLFDQIKEENSCSCKPKILIVDDNAFNLFALKTLITNMNIAFSLIE